MWFQKISIPPPQRVIGNFEGEGGVLKAKIFKGKYDFQRGGGSSKKKNLCGQSIWIFLEQHNEPKFLYPKKVPSS